MLRSLRRRLVVLAALASLSVLMALPMLAPRAPDASLHASR